MTDYQLGKIYRIVCNTTGLTYYGSTCEPTLARRLGKHVGTYKRFKDGKKEKYMSSYEILEGGNYTIVLVELFPCNSKMMLHQRERYYIENNDCVNMYIPARTQEEYREINKSKINEYASEYRLNNKEKIKEQQANYFLNNKEKIKEQQANYFLNNKDKIKERQANYRLNNPEKIKEGKANYRLNNPEQTKINDAKYNLKTKEAKLAKLLSADILA